MLLEVNLNTASWAWKLVSVSGVPIEAEAEAVGASGLLGSPLQVVLLWGGGQGERRGSCIPTPPHCHVPPLLSLASGLEKVWEKKQPRDIYRRTVNMDLWNIKTKWWREETSFLKYVLFGFCDLQLSKNCHSWKDTMLHSCNVVTVLVQRT